VQLAKAPTPFLIKHLQITPSLPFSSSLRFLAAPAASNHEDSFPPFDFHSQHHKLPQTMNTTHGRIADSPMMCGNREVQCTGGMVVDIIDNQRSNARFAKTVSYEREERLEQTHFELKMCRIGKG
jgi:hypothetical protein